MKRIVWFLLVVTAVFLYGRPAVQSAHDKTISQSLLNIEEDGMLVHWQVPAPQIFVEGQISYVEIPGYLMTEEPGEYLLPVDAKLIAVPDGAQPTVEVVSLTQSSYPLIQAPAIAPAPVGFVTDEDGQVVGGDFRPVINANPQLPLLVDLNDVGMMRGVRIMRLTLTPVRPQHDVYLVAEQVSVRVRFNQPEQTALLGDSGQMANTAVSDTLLKTVQSMVVNPQQVGGFQSNASFKSQLQTKTTSSPTVAIEVSEVGITAVTYAELADTGFPVGSANPQNLHLKHGGVEVPIEWIGDGDTIFEANEKFLFYAAPRFSRWFNGDIYLLTADNSAGDRIGTQSAPPGSLSEGQVLVDTTIEVNDLYTPDCLCGSLPLGRDGDRFVWDFFTPDNRYKQRNYSIPLATVDTSVDAELTLWFIGYTNPEQNPDHQVDVTWNGVNLGSEVWNGKTAVTSTLTIPSANLQSTNTMTLTLVNPSGVTVNGFWFDAAHVRYARNDAQVDNALQFTGEATQHKYNIGLASTTGLRVYDVTDPETPQKLTGWTSGSKSVSLGDPVDGIHNYALSNQNGVLSPNNLRLLKTLQTENTTGANYIVISPAEFMPALNSFVTLRQSQGLQVVVEDVQAIYDRYGGGFPVPDAIHDYLANAYANWTPVPEYVLLVGDASFDPKQYRTDSTKTWVAPFLLEADPWIGEVPADNRFVTLDGGIDDLLPDMMIGRLPVNSLSEAQTVVNKIVQYETNPEFGPWNGNLVFVADNYYTLDPDAPTDKAGDHHSHADSLIDGYVDSPWVPRRAYLDLTYNPADEVSVDLLNYWQQGSGIILYSGHSSRHQWAAERIFHVDDVSLLKNGARLPVVLEMTCLTGAFHIPDLVTLDEELVRSENGGAVAVWGATGLGVATGHKELASGFLQTVLVDENPVIGQAVLAGKLNLKNFHRDLLDTFTLLGDPYLHLDQELPEHQVYLPAVER